MLILSVLATPLLWYLRRSREQTRQNIIDFAELVSADHPGKPDKPHGVDARRKSPTSVVDKRAPAKKDDKQIEHEASITLLRGLVRTTAEEHGPKSEETQKAARALAEALEKHGGAEEAERVRVRFNVMAVESATPSPATDSQ